MVIDLDRVLECAKEAARAAGEVLAPVLGRPGRIREKAGGPVTDADIAAETAIVGVIRRAFPDHAILSEEMGDQGAGPARWIIDPLDGTANFIHGVPWYDVSIAFEVDGRIEAAAVLAPSTGLLFTAARGRGARLNGRPIAVSTQQSLSGGIVDLGFLREDWSDPARVDRVARLAQAGVEIRNLNAAGLDLAFVAAGWLDGYWDPGVCIWDFAAGALLVSEAGGRVLLHPAPAGDGARMVILASNASMHDRLRELAGLGDLEQ